MGVWQLVCDHGISTDLFKLEEQVYALHPVVSVSILKTNIILHYIIFKTIMMTKSLLYNIICS